MAVKTLLAKVNLELENYEEALKYADIVINSNKELLDYYEDLFTNEENSEAIFELCFTELLSDKNRLAEVESLVLEDKVLDWVLDSAEVTEITKLFKDVMQPKSTESA